MMGLFYGKVKWKLSGSFLILCIYVYVFLNEDVVVSCFYFRRFKNCRLFGCIIPEGVCNLIVHYMHVAIISH